MGIYGSEYEGENDPEERLIRHWEQGLENLQTEDWEYLLGGEDLDSVNAEDLWYDTVWYDQKNAAKEVKEVGVYRKRGTITRPKLKLGTMRQREILRWLKKSKLREEISPRNSGFRIPWIAQGVRKDGSRCRVALWLLEEGFEDNLVLDECRVIVESIREEEKSIRFESMAFRMPI